jgi:hypothetical protein
MIQKDERTVARSTDTTPPKPAVNPTHQLADVGDIVLVALGDGIRRPMLVSHTEMALVGLRNTPSLEPPVTRLEFRVSGMIVCEPSDHVLSAFRGGVERPADPARIYGRPERALPLVYAELLGEGAGVGQWTPIGKPLPSGG